MSLRSYITKGSANTRGGHLAFRLRVRGRLARAGGFTFRSIESAAPRKRVAAAAGRPGRWFRRRFAAPMIRRQLYNRVFTRLPIRRGTVVFESHLGKQYSDNPKYIYECLRATGVPIRAIWSYRDSPEGFPAEAHLVKRGSLAYYRALARAEFWIDNQGFPADAHKRAETTYIQTWHGSAFKRMGFDQPDIKLARPSARTRLRRMVDRFDYFVVRSAHDEQTLLPGFELRAEPLRVGYPRNDGLVAGGDPVGLDRLREELGLADGRRVVLYAPTFRSDRKGKVRTFGLPFDADRFVREFGARYILLVRAHYLNKGMVASTPCGSVRDVSHVHDVTSLQLLSDALVTDYSSVMFDYALLDRPMLFHAPDLEDYVRSRGSYFDLAEHAPGPVTRDEEEFFAALHGLDGPDEYAGARRRFVERFGEYDTGVAAKSIVQQFFVPEAPRGW